MRFLADESCDFRVVRALRAAGHEVSVIVDVAPGMHDEAVIATALREQRTLITEDRDFGQLAYAAARPTGVILLRYPSQARASLPATVVDFVARRGNELRDRFIVIEPGRIRIGGGT